MKQNNLNIEFFQMGLQQLQDLHGYKITESQAGAWFERLRYFSKDAFRIAIDQLSETDARKVNYPILKKHLAKANARLKRKARTPIVKKHLIQGWAPMTEAKRQMVNHFLASWQHAKTEEQKKQLITEWHEQYRLLPGYTTEEQVLKAIEDEDIETLSHLDILNPEFLEEVKIPKLQNESGFAW